MDYEHYDSWTLTKPMIDNILSYPQVEQLQKSEGTVISFSKAIARTLKKYIKEDSVLKIKCSDCGSKNVSMQEGCFICIDCGSSKCS